MEAIAEEQLARIAARARDVRRRTFTSGVQAQAQPVDLEALAEDVRRHGAPGSQPLAALAAVLGKVFGAGGGAVAMGPGGPMRFGGDAPSAELAPPPDAGALVRAEAVIGRSLPKALRQLYSIGDGGFGPGQGLFSLAELVRRYREHTDEPYGPLGQEWPPQLLPLLDDHPVLTCLDLDTGAVVAWDAEAIEDLDSEADWQASFAVEHDSLAALLEAWLASPVFGE